MKRVVIISVLILMFVVPARAQLGFTEYHNRTDFLMSSPGSLKFGLYGYDNPAMPATMHQGDLLFQWNDYDGFDLNHWGIFAGGPNLGFGAVTIGNDDFRSTDYRLSTAFGDENASFGLGYGWYGGDGEGRGFDSNISMGTLTRPNRYMSIGLFGTRSLERADYEGVADLGIRPFGTENVTVFGDYAVNSEDGFSDATWSAGASVEALPGVRITSRYIHDVGVTGGLQISFGRGGASVQSHMDTDLEHSFNSYSVRLGAYDRNIADTYFRDDQKYVDVNLRGSMSYQSRRFFDDYRTQIETLEGIEEAREDDSVSGIVVNATAMALSQGMVWEVRDELKKFRAEGKNVILYLERGGMNALHLISEADKVVMDPEGSLNLPGYVMGSTYLADLMESVGVGVDEFREMEYKSAFETISRTGMSDADREQRQQLIDGFYDLARDGIVNERRLNEADYDSLINFGASLLPDELVEAGLVDTLVRHTDINDVIESLEGESKRRTSPGDLVTYQLPGDDRWGADPKIGVLYAIGPTMTEVGIRGRQLASEFKKMRKDDDIKAIVMRADSPGGDALASDLVAEQMRKAAEEKPVIVSMGNVAASGGYWISMYADTIMALPNTVTGSIGVIGGWLYDDGVSDHLNLHTDHVQRGESADLMFGPSLPLVGLSLPDRSLTEEERAQFVDRLNTLYDRFIDKVADGREMEYDEVKEVAAGRVWTGEDAIDIGLVDELGTLYAAIHMAREQAGIPEDEKFEIVEGPEPPLFQIPSLLSLMGIEEPGDKDPMVKYLEMMIDHKGDPLVMMPFEYYHMYYRMLKMD